MIDQGIPEFLWPEILMAMITVTNVTATQTIKDMTPYKYFMNQVDLTKSYIPDVSHFRVLGAKTYVQIPVERRVKSYKGEPCSEIRFLVRYEGSKIYRVYIPSRPREKIIRSSNCRFDKGIFQEESELVITSESQQPQNQGETITENETTRDSEAILTTLEQRA